MQHGAWMRDSHAEIIFHCGTLGLVRGFFSICVGFLFFNLFKSTVVNALLAKTSH